MSIQYDFYQNPPQKGSNEQPKLHARVKPKGTMTTAEIVELINQFTSFSTADAKGVLEAFLNMLKMALHSGKVVQIDGLGLFSLTLDCPSLDTPTERRAESIRVKSVSFRPAPELVNDFKAADLERARLKYHSHSCTPEEIDRRLTLYFKDHHCITRKQFCRLCGVTFATSIRRINDLIAADKLRKADYGVGVYEQATRDRCDSK